MHPDLHNFLARLGGTIAMALLFVVLIAFVSIPLSLQHHPGEHMPDVGAPADHMT